jgi:hypothetical protein
MPELEGFEGRVADHRTWAECREALLAHGRRVHDFYFRPVEAEGHECDELLIWSMGAVPGAGRIDSVRLTDEADHDEIRAFMRDAFFAIRKRLASAPGRGGWDASEREFKEKGGWFFDNVKVPTFDRFLEDFAVADARNLLFDLHIVPMPSGRSMLRFWMTHPGRGYDREILVGEAQQSQADALARLVSDHLAFHRRNFAWALSDTDEPAIDTHDRIASLMRKAA